MKLMKIKFNPVVTILASGLLAGTAHGQVEKIDKGVSPLVVKTSAIYNDNFNPTVKGEQGAYGIVIEPTGALVTTGEGYGLKVAYQGRLQQMKFTDDDLKFDDSQDFNRYGASVLGRLYLSESMHLDAKVEHVQDTQLFGKGISSSNKNVYEPDELALTSGTLSLVYGGDTDERFVAFTLGTRDFDYDPINSYSELFNLTQTSARLEMAFAQSSATRIVAKLEATDEDYDSQVREDSKMYRGLVGVDWRPTGKSRLRALVGVYSREFDQGESNNGASWEFQYSHSPSKLWLIDLTSAQFSDVSEDEDTSDTRKQEFKGKVSYKYSDKWKYAVYAKHLTTTFYFTDKEKDKDESSAGFEADLKLADHSKLSFKVGYKDVSSSDNSTEYSQNEVGIAWEHEF